jgi:hypothetical protein
MPTDDLDARIRSVVADAVAAAPPPPDLGAEASSRVAPVVALGAVRSRRWLAPAAAVLTAAAAVVGLVFVANRDADTAVVPGTDVIAPAAPVNVVTAGSDGVWVVGSDGQRTQWWDQSAAFAVQASDGSLIVQRFAGGVYPSDGSDAAWEPADTLPLRLAGPNASPVLLSEDLPIGWYTLQDVAQLLDGRMMALLTRQNVDTVGEMAGVTWVYAVDLRTGSVDVIAGAQPLNFSSRLQLAETGVVVAEYSHSSSRNLWSAVVGGRDLAKWPIERAQVGLETSYANTCADCPRLFAIDRTGAVLGWLEGDELVLHSLATETLRRVPLGGRAGGATGIDIELGGAGDLGGPFVVAVEYGGDGPRSIVLEVGTGDSVTEWPIGTAERVSLNPSTTEPSDAVTTTMAPDTAVPTSTDAAPITSVGTDIPASVVTAGRDGVWVVDRDGTKVQWWNQSAAFAVWSPDGSLIVQQHSGNGGPCCAPDGGWEAAATMPLRLVGPNSYPVFLSADLPGGWYRLHDVARLLDGRVMALVEWQTTVDAGLETESGRLYAVDLQTGAAVVVSDRFGGWEEGSSRLHLAENGLIVGEYSSGVTKSFFSAVVPGGAPLATEPLPPTVLPHPAAADDCGNCPTLYAIDRTGNMLAWIDGDDLVLRSLEGAILPRVPLGGRASGTTDIDVDLRIGGIGGPVDVVLQYGYDTPSGIVLEVGDLGDPGITEWPIGTPERVSLLS